MEKQTKRHLKRGITYVLIAIPVGFLLMKIIESKQLVLFWSYYAIMGVSALIAAWTDGEDYNKKSAFMKAADDTCFVTFFGLIAWYSLEYLKT